MVEYWNGNEAEAQPYSSLRDLRDVPEATAEPGFRTLGELLLGMRRAKGWSRRQLSDIAGVDPDTIANVERAAHVPRHETLRRMALALIDQAAPWSTEDDEIEARGDIPDAQGAAPPAIENGGEPESAGDGVDPEGAGAGERLVRREVVVVTETWVAGGGGAG